MNFLINLIEILKYLFFGAVQGITETLPISSSGHLVIVNDVLHISDQSHSLSILLHFGSLIAVFIFFRKTIIELIKNFFLFIFKKERTPYAEDFRYAWLIIVATVPAGIVGYLLNDFFSNHLNNMFTVGIALLATALILLLISRFPKGDKGKKEITFLDAIIIGIIQAVAIIPGISRSGSTISAGLSRKMSIDESIRFAFLLFIPAALGAAVLDVPGFIKENLSSSIIVLDLIAFVTATLFTYLSLFFLIGIIKKGKLSYFSIYCTLMGLASVIYYLTVLK